MTHPLISRTNFILPFGPLVELNSSLFFTAKSKKNGGFFIVCKLQCSLLLLQLSHLVAKETVGLEQLGDVLGEELRRFVETLFV